MDARASLLEGLIDYAGLFPPAALDLPTALRRYDAHQRGNDARLLGRFVLPAARLPELTPWLDGPWLPERPLPVSLLAAPEDLAAAADVRDLAPAAWKPSSYGFPATRTSTSGSTASATCWRPLRPRRRRGLRRAAGRPRP
ncbi:MAG: hypothetical protein R3D98_07400 [Candidatus Krumholzibacteriia bacterium]